MVHHIKNNHIQHKNIYLIFGTRVIQDLLYPGEMQGLQEEMDSFNYLPVCSREPENNPRGMRTGYVHGVYESLISQKLFQPQEGGPDLPPTAYFYMCGWKNMIDEARQRLTALGYDKKSIHFELYG
jgi:Na+-transporting NADH:ubiquinone oxidoreductase subunit NqrF